MMASDWTEPYRKLTTLLATAGKDSLLCAFDFFVPPKQMQEFFQNDITRCRLKELCQYDMLTADQYRILTSGNVSTDNLDIGELFLLLRYCVESVGEPQNGWEGEIDPGDKSMATDLLRLRWLRNEIFFRPVHSLEGNFDALWSQVRSLLLRIVRSCNQDDTPLESQVSTLRTQALVGNIDSYEHYRRCISTWCSADMKRFEILLHNTRRQSLPYLIQVSSNNFIQYLSHVSL